MVIELKTRPERVETMRSNLETNKAASEEFCASAGIAHKKQA